jgi:hypothetical protein
MPRTRWYTIYIDRNPNNLDEGFGWVEVTLEDLERLKIARGYSAGRWGTRQKKITVTKYNNSIPYTETFTETYTTRLNLPSRGKAAGKKFTLLFNGELVIVKAQKSLTTNAVCAWIKTWASSDTKIVTPGNRQISLDGDKLAHQSYFVYFILNEDSSAIKIGKAKDISKRIKSLQTSSPAKLRLIKSIQVKSDKEAQELEQSLHKQFQEIRLAGEWFKAEANLLDYINQV